ncbi:hypothetical protein ACLQ29_31490 [Micromonospora sp. DT228]|uniref:hypothetical protein n=1 Tax=Micromonospora sp. DT228 TaxID=3393443 RepID=UPI003CEAD8F4
MCTLEGGQNETVTSVRPGKLVTFSCSSCQPSFPGGARDPASPSIPQAREILGKFHIQRHKATASARRPDDLVQTLMYWLAALEAVLNQCATRCAG